MRFLRAVSVLRFADSMRHTLGDEGAWLAMMIRVHWNENVQLQRLRRQADFAGGGLSQSFQLPTSSASLRGTVLGELDRGTYCLFAANPPPPCALWTDWNRT